MARPHAQTGAEFDALSPEQQAAASRSLAVFARVEPLHKLKLVELLRAQGFADARQRALALYAPMFFAYTLYDAENGAEAANALMEAHFSRLEAAWTTDERKC